MTDEIPEGTKFIDAKGYVPLAGGYEISVFSMPSESFLRLINESEFKESSLSEVSNVNYHLENMKNYDLTPVHVYLKSYLPDAPHMSGVLLFANEEKSLVYLYRWKI